MKTCFRLESQDLTHADVKWSSLKHIHSKWWKSKKPSRDNHVFLAHNDVGWRFPSLFAKLNVDYDYIGNAIDYDYISFLVNSIDYDYSKNCNQLQSITISPCLHGLSPAGKDRVWWDHSQFFILIYRWLGGKSMRRKIDPRKLQNYQWSTVVQALWWTCLIKQLGCGWNDFAAFWNHTCWLLRYVKIRNQKTVSTRIDNFAVRSKPICPTDPVSVVQENTVQFHFSSVYLSSNTGWA